MFKGIVEEIGMISNIDVKDSILNLTIKAKKVFENLKVGDSIAVDGVCQTVTSIKDHSFTVQAVAETLKRTNFQVYEIATQVNLERALTLNDRIDGHLVQGHVDDIGKVHDFKKSEDENILYIKFPPNLSKFLAFKGSICVNGVSLTIMDLQSDFFGVALIPYTLKFTNLGKLKKDNLVNLEIDLIARYLERMLNEKNNEAKFDWLKERN